MTKLKNTYKKRFVPLLFLLVVGVACAIALGIFVRGSGSAPTPQPRTVAHCDSWSIPGQSEFVSANTDYGFLILKYRGMQFGVMKPALVSAPSFTFDKQFGMLKGSDSRTAAIDNNTQWRFMRPKFTNTDFSVVNDIGLVNESKTRIISEVSKARLIINCCSASGTAIQAIHVRSDDPTILEVAANFAEEWCVVDGLNEESMTDTWIDFLSSVKGP